MPVMLNHGYADLVGDIWTSITDVATHLSHDANMFIAVQKRVFFLSLCAWSSISSREDRFVCFETRVGQDYDESLGVLVGRGNRNVLLCDELWESWRR